MRRKVTNPRSMTIQEKERDDRFNRCVEFHGHRCPGLAIGFQAAQALMDRLGVTRAPDEELVAIVETDACGADAIQVMTGCTFGKGNFIFRNYGKHAFALADRRKGRTARACLRPNTIPSNPEDVVLSEKVRNETASPEELEQYRNLKEERIQEILESPFESLFKIEDVSFQIPPEAQIVESGTCDYCGEPTKVDLLGDLDGRKACIPCREKFEFQQRHRKK
jgi:formylmethanofuran dehydrogenase subunit E